MSPYVADVSSLSKSVPIDTPPELAESIHFDDHAETVQYTPYSQEADFGRNFSEPIGSGFTLSNIGRVSSAASGNQTPATTETTCIFH